MPWLIAFLVAHQIEIAAIGAAAYAVSQIESAAINAEVIVKDAPKPEPKP